MSETQSLNGESVVAGFKRAAAALRQNSDKLTEHDQAMGDGDLGITASKIADAVDAYIADAPGPDLGKYIMTAGMKVNSVASSTMGTLVATALMRAGKEIAGQDSFNSAELARMIAAATQGIQDRGKANLGDKTVLDALHPASVAFGEAIQQGADLQAAGEKMLAAAQAGLESVTPLRSKIGRASWVGERTEGLVDPGCLLLVTALRALIEPTN